MDKLGVDLRVERAPLARAPLTAVGQLRLDDGVFPVLARSAAPLGKYGLAALSEQSTLPATCAIALSERGWSFTDVRTAVRACEATGRVDVAAGGVLEGAPRREARSRAPRKQRRDDAPGVASRLGSPCRSASRARRPAPIVDADLAACFGNLVTNNRVSALLGGAAAGRRVRCSRARTRARRPPRCPESPTLDPDPARVRRATRCGPGEDALLRELVVSGVDWSTIDARVQAHRAAAER